MSEVRYSALPQEDRMDKKSAANGDADSKLNRFIRWSILIIIVCFVYDGVLLLYLSSLPFFRLQPSIAFDQLPIRSTYFKLDELYAKNHTKTTPRGPITNLPRVLLHADSSRPKAILPRWSGMWATDGGMVPYDERQVIVTPKISTIAEFHVMDFGMEKCTLTLSTPPTEVETSLPEANVLDAWLLSWDRALDEGQLTWSSKPARKEHIGVFNLKSNSTQQLPQYHCHSGTYQIFELSCRTGNCNVHIAATMKKPIGLYMTQHQTI